MQKPETIIVIPARGGSKRIKNKNLFLVNGIPLIDYTIQHALSSSFCSEIYISTDSELLKKHLKKFRVNIIERPKNISGDTSSSELALINVLDYRKKIKKKDPTNIIFLQCTSPYRDNLDIDNAYEKFQSKNYDSLLSVVKSKKFIWKNSNNIFKTVNYDYKKRPREQDFNNFYEENGSIYITKVKNLRSSNNRLSGKIGFYEMNYFSSIQIDEPYDLKIISSILPRRRSLDLKKIQIIISDFDGVFTDNNLYLNDSGSESVKLSRSDGMAIQMLKEKDIKFVVISSEKNKVVHQRCKKLGIECFHGVKNKLDFLRNYLKNKKLKMNQVMYIGNDINDYECMRNCRISVTVNDGAEKIKQISDYILSKNGGNGAIRELAELILGDNNE
tara:strand:+ start:47 stop:1210 length:1164 start_codon:yes stop_codon:yes gene_type:complete